MRSVVIHFRQAGLMLVAGIGLIFGAAGCWQEIEYVAPDPVASKTATNDSADNEQATTNGAVTEMPVTGAAQNSDVAAEASGFGDELTANLAAESTEASDTEASASQPDSNDRYGVEEPDSTMLLPHESPEPTDSSDPGATTDALLGRTSTDPPQSEPTSNESIEATAAPTSAQQNSADVSDTSPTQSFNTRLAAWQLGSKLSLAALANDRGVAAEKVERWLADSRTVANTLNTTLSDLPPAGAAGQSGNPSREVLEHLFQQSAQLSRHLTSTYGSDHAALYELAVKSNLLLVLYQPGSSTTGAIAAAIGDAAPRAKLPEAAVKPLLVLVSNRAEPAEVRKHVQRLHAQVEQYLGQLMER